MRRWFALLAGIASLSAISGASAAAPSASEAEGAMAAALSTGSCRKTLRLLTEEPHVAGTEEGRRTAEFVRDELAACGFDAKLVEYHVYLGTVRNTAARLLEPEALELSLRERGDPADKDGFDRSAMPGYCGYSPAGKVSGHVVYANYGLPEDFEKLAELGIRVRGKIVLARYGRSYRGVKAKAAADAGAAGLILYSDPADDGYAKGDVYPVGPWRPDSAIQRGSIVNMMQYPGDPLTPFVAATKGAKRLSPAAAENLPKIPCLPMSYGEASKILRSIAGPNVPDGWQGALPFAYHAGPGPARVELEIACDYGLRPIQNVIATLRGETEPDSWIVFGNHRDAWVYGAVDPNSGTTVLLEAARGLAAARKAGWRPDRTIVLASWDGEEWGLLGSTEWGEEHAKELSRKALCYLNCDAAISGSELGAAGVPSLASFFTEVAASVPDPRAPGKSLRDGFEDRARKAFEKGEAVRPRGPSNAKRAYRPHLGALGSGSDYTVFLDHLGIPSLDFAMHGPYGVYHSAFDDLFWMEKFGDPGFLNHVACARLVGTLLLRLSGVTSPFRWDDYARTIAEAAEDLEHELTQLTPAPPVGSFPPDLSSLRAAAKELEEAGRALAASTDSRAAASAGAAAERELLDPRGLPSRPWFRHTIYAPGTVTGYEAWVLPGLRAALRARDAPLFRAEADKAAAAIRRAASRLRARP